MTAQPAYGAGMVAEPEPDVAASLLQATRDSLHRAAEHLLAATRKRASGEITLVPAPGGVATPALPDGRVVSLEGAEVVVRGPGGVRRAPLTTLAETAEALGLQPGFPWTTHRPGTEYEPDARLFVDKKVAAALAGWFALGEEALLALAAEAPAERPSAPQIFPEHFDLGITAGAVNYGFSAGDDAISEPYAYVGPHDAPTDDPFWNAAFGAYRTWDEIATVEEATRFFRAARAVLGL
jgi:hypothetical protein